MIDLKSFTSRLPLIFEMILSGPGEDQLRRPQRETASRWVGAPRRITIPNRMKSSGTNGFAPS